MMLLFIILCFKFISNKICTRMDYNCHLFYPLEHKHHQLIVEVLIKASHGDMTSQGVV